MSVEQGQRTIRALVTTVGPDTSTGETTECIRESAPER
ncbi:MAG: hypothetical protein J07HX64_01932 [halophilic archaeon J07HX64]|jgi:hypothetical protein|nr:MAG: hypothetical protein J07HX64_01932 [halophilic archaeon J07HX64]